MSTLHKNRIRLPIYVNNAIRMDRGDFLAVLLLRTFIFYTLLTALIRLMGKRQLGELQITELIIALMLSDIAVIPITDPDIPLLHADK